MPGSVASGTLCISYVHRNPYNIVITALIRDVQTQHAVVTRNIPRVLFTHCGFSSSKFITSQKG
jgi:hypothetical protein